MPKKLSVPMLKDETLFESLRGDRVFQDLAPFNSPGSIPATLSDGMVNSRPGLYRWEDNPIITGTLRFLKLYEVSYVGAGIVMVNVDTGAAYFMLSDDYAHMMDQTVSDHNQITGSWRVIKQGHAFGLQWITPKAAPEPLRLD